MYQPMKPQPPKRPTDQKLPEEATEDVVNVELTMASSEAVVNTEVVVLLEATMLPEANIEEPQEVNIEVPQEVNIEVPQEAITEVLPEENTEAIELEVMHLTVDQEVGTVMLHEQKWIINNMTMLRSAMDQSH
jgi:hypothetical protein